MRFQVGAALLCAVLLPHTAFAQAPPRPATDPIHVASALTSSAPRFKDAGDDDPRVHSAAWGGLIGGATAAAITAWAAASYGQSETGTFCTGCFAHWSTMTVPSGVVIGVAIGFAADAIRRQTTNRQPAGRVVVTPVVAKRGGGVFVSTRF